MLEERLDEDPRPDRQGATAGVEHMDVHAIRLQCRENAHESAVGNCVPRDEVRKACYAGAVHGEEMPPETKIFIWSAPLRSSSRAALRTSSGPSAT